MTTKKQRHDKRFLAAPIALRFSEEVRQEEVPPKVQVLRTCTFYHDTYGKVEITRQLLSEMKENFDKGVRGIIPAIDYSHKSEDIAAGWVKSVELHENQEGETEMWVGVDWTPNGRRILSDKEFGYLSADFHPNYADNESPDQKYGAVLFGAALTNRPVIKKMNPAIQLAEINNNPESKEPEMEGEKEGSGNSKEMQEKMEYQENKLKKVKEVMDELGIDSVEDLMETVRKMKKEKADLAEEKELSEKTQKLNKLFSEGKITKAQMEEAKKLKGEQFESYFKLAEMNTAMKQTEDGHGGEPKGGQGDKSAMDEVLELAEKKRKENEGMDHKDSISLVLSENKELKARYKKEIEGE